MRPFSPDSMMSQLAHSPEMARFESWFIRELGYGGWIEHTDGFTTAHRSDGTVHSSWPVPDRSMQRWTGGEMPKFDLSGMARAASARVDELIKGALCP